MALEAVDRPQTPEAKVGPGFDEILIVTDQTGPEWVAAQQIETDVFVEADYVNTPEELLSEYAPYADASRFVAVKRQGQTVGSARLIVPGPNGFKTLKDAEAGKLTITEEGRQILAQYDLDTQGFEVGTMSIQKGLRSGPFAPDSISASVYAGITGYTEIFAHQKNRNERGFVLASFDQGFLDNFQSAFGGSVKPLGPNQDYMGSPTTPVLIDVEQLVNYKENGGLSELLVALSRAAQTDV